MDLFGILVGVLGLGFGVWQWLDARKAKHELANLVKVLPDRFLKNVSNYLKGSQGQALELYDLQGSDGLYHTRVVDLNEDGVDELLVQYPIRAHNAALKVFAIRGDELRLITELEATTMAGFVVGDFDNDGKLEIKTWEVSLAADLPYVCGFRDEVWYRLQDGNFIEIRREPQYKPEELESFRSRDAADSATL